MNIERKFLKNSIEHKFMKIDENRDTNHDNLWLSVDIQPSSHQVLELWRSAAEAAACKLSGVLGLNLDPETQHVEIIGK